MMTVEDRARICKDVETAVANIAVDRGLDSEMEIVVTKVECPTLKS